MATHGEPTSCWLAAGRSLADLLWEQARAPPLLATHSDPPSCVKYHHRICPILSRVCHLQGGAVSCRHSPAPRGMNPRYSEIHQWQVLESKDRLSLLFLLISSADILIHNPVHDQFPPAP